MEVDRLRAAPSSAFTRRNASGPSGRFRAGASQTGGSMEPEAGSNEAGLAGRVGKGVSEPRAGAFLLAAPSFLLSWAGSRERLRSALHPVAAGLGDASPAVGPLAWAADLERLQLAVPGRPTVTDFLGGASAHVLATCGVSTGLSRSGQLV